MRKYLLITALMICAVNTIHSQVLISILLGDKLNSGNIEFGLDGGLNWSNIKGLEPSKSLSGFNLGFYFDFKLKKAPWMINTGVIVKGNMGADELPVYSLGNAALDSSIKGGKVARKINYFSVPVMIKYRFENNIFLKAGIQLGLRYSAFDKFTNSIHDEEDLTYKLKIKDQFHPLDAGLAVGAGYRFMKGNGMNLGIQYYYGLVDVVVNDTSPNQFNRAFYLNIGIPIGVKKAKEKAANKTTSPK